MTWILDCGKCSNLVKSIAVQHSLFISNPSDQIMHYELVLLFSFSIFLPALTGLIRFNYISSHYYPFIICTWVGALNEMVSMLVSRAGIPTSFNNNIYMLAEALLICRQFKQWGLFEGRTELFPATVACLCIGWIFNYLYIDSTGNLFYFSIGYSLLVVLAALFFCTEQLFFYPSRLITNTKFILCCGCIIYFTFRILIESFWHFGIHSSKAFRNEVFITMVWVNLLFNILICISFLWIPKKLNFISNS